MHDIDRTQLEASEFGETTEFGEFGEVGELGEFGEFGEVGEGPLGEALETELASELLEIASEDELEDFLGNLIGTVGRAAGQFVRSDTGRALGGILQNAARQALPIVGRAAGQWIAPGSGGAIGADLARRAGQMFGLELEGLSLEDREFEVAKRYVRFASEAVRQAAIASPAAPAPIAASRAVEAAASMHAPGLRRLRGRSGQLWPRSGRWLRRGRSIVLFGG